MRIIELIMGKSKSRRRAPQSVPQLGRPEPSVTQGRPQTEIQDLLKKVRYCKDQMTNYEYGLISGLILDFAPCRLLVFGLGRDSDMWVHLNAGGTTVFLEDIADWFFVPIGASAHLVNYSEFLLPPEVASQRFDIAIIDGPMGYLPEHPGRELSIKAASEQLNEGGWAIVHDYNRPAEKKWATQYLGTPTLEVDRLAVFKKLTVVNS